jgi:hypothetical protein
MLAIEPSIAVTVAPAARISGQNLAAEKRGESASGSPARSAAKLVACSAFMWKSGRQA